MKLIKSSKNSWFSQTRKFRNFSRPKKSLFSIEPMKFHEILLSRNSHKSPESMDILLIPRNQNRKISRYFSKASRKNHMNIISRDSHFNRWLALNIAIFCSDIMASRSIIIRTSLHRFVDIQISRFIASSRNIFMELSAKKELLITPQN